MLHYPIYMYKKRDMKSVEPSLMTTVNLAQRRGRFKVPMHCAEE